MIEAFQECHNINIDHLLMLLPWSILQFSKCMETCNITHESHIKVFCCFKNLVSTVGLCKICTDNHVIHTICFADTLSKLLKFLFSSSYQDNTHSLRCDFLCKCFSNSFCCSKDDPPLTVFFS